MSFNVAKLKCSFSTPISFEYLKPEISLSVLNASHEDVATFTKYDDDCHNDSHKSGDIANGYRSAFSHEKDKVIGLKMSPCQGWIDYCLNNPFTMLEM